MNRCVTYARVSTDDQAERGYSLPSQAREMADYAKRKGLTIVDQLSDDGVSGAVLERPALTTLRDGVRARRWDVVLVHAPDRLSRSLAHQLLLLDELRKARVRVEFCTMQNDDSAEGRLLLHVSGTIAEYEREKIKERTLRGKREKARRGLVVSPRACPFGYRPDPARPGHLMIYEPEAEVVRLIFRLCVDEHRPTRAIVKELHRLGLRSGRGAWGRRQVRRVLTGELHAGTLVYNRRQALPNGKCRERTRDEWIEIQVPQIIDPARVAAARLQLAKNRRTLTGRPPARQFLLRGLLSCAACGRRYRGTAWRKALRYQHPAADPLEARSRCSLPAFALAAKDTEKSVRDAITKALSDPTVLRAAVERYEAARGATDVELKSRVAYLQKQIATIRRNEQRLIGLVVGDAEQATMVEAKLRDLARRRGGLAAELREAEAKAAAHGAGNRTEAIEAICAQARRGLAALDEAGWAALLREVVDEVRVTADRTLEIRGILDEAGVTAPAGPDAAGTSRPCSSSPCPPPYEMGRAC